MIILIYSFNLLTTLSEPFDSIYPIIWIIMKIKLIDAYDTTADLFDFRFVIPLYRLSIYDPFNSRFVILV